MPPPPDRVKALLMDEADMARTLDRLARQVVEEFDEPDRAAIVGLQTRGVHLARRLCERIEAFEGVRLAVGESLPCHDGQGLSWVGCSPGR